jgi:glycosyltransferase involved in cell wall biosynthesis
MNTFIKYIPHGINETSFFRYTDAADLARVEEMRKGMFAGEKAEFVVLYNNRNIRRKMTGNVILAFREFVLGLPKDKRDGVRLVLHTQPVDDNGTDLIALIRDLAPEIKVTFSANRVDTRTMNDIYNVADVVINLASAEGFGLGTLEALMAEKLIIANVTGGLQDQMGFRDDAGNFVNEEEHFGKNWGSNHDGKYKTHGEWVLPIFPATRTLIGSPPTPYIFEDYCRFEDAAVALRQAYDMGKEELQRRGRLGREYALAEGFSARIMSQGFIDGIDAVLARWKPRERFTLIKA